MRVETPLSYDEAVARVREALAGQGFGVLTEIDVRATMKAKLDVDVPAQVILGACRPQLAHKAMTAAPAIAVLLPCNVVVRDDAGTTVVETIDPDAMSRLEDRPQIGRGRGGGPDPAAGRPRRRRPPGGVMDLKPDDMRAVINRAKRAHGHLGKVIAMLEEGGDCEAVVTQLSAVLKALEKTGFAIVATGLQQCMATGDGPDSVDVKKMEKLFLNLA